MNPLQKFAGSITRFADAVKLRYLGLGFVWAWVYCAWDTSLLFFSPDGLSINADPSWLISAATITATLFAGAIIWRTKRPVRVTETAAVAALLAAAGTLGIAAAHASGRFGAVSALCAGATGIGIGLLYMLWADSLSDLDQESTEAVIPLCAAVPVLFTLVPYNTSHTALTWILVALLPVVSAVLLLMASGDPATRKARRAEDARTDGAALRKAAPVFARLGASLIALFTVLCFLAASIDAEALAQSIALTAGIDISTLASSLLGIVLAVAFVTYSVRIDFAATYRWLLPLTVFAIACSSLLSSVGDTLSLMAQSMINVAIETIVFIFFLDFARRNSLSAACCIGLMWGCCQVGILAGNLTGSWLLNASAQSEGLLLAAVPWLALVLTVGAAIVPSSAVRLNAAPGASEPEGADAEDGFAAFAARYGLTEREREICAMLVKGRSLPYIRDQLFLSKNTVATHAKHIYKKVDVHSKQELMDAYERQR